MVVGVEEVCVECLLLWVQVRSLDVLGIDDLLG